MVILSNKFPCKWAAIKDRLLAVVLETREIDHLRYSDSELSRKEKSFRCRDTQDLTIVVPDKKKYSSVSQYSIECDRMRESRYCKKCAYTEFFNGIKTSNDRELLDRVAQSATRSWPQLPTHETHHSCASDREKLVINTYLLKITLLYLHTQMTFSRTLSS